MPACASRGCCWTWTGRSTSGGEPVEGAREAVEKLAASGLALRYVTNTTRKPRRAVREQLYALGFEVEEAPTGAECSVIAIGRPNRAAYRRRHTNM